MTNEDFRILHLDPFNELNVDAYRMNINYNSISGTEGEIIGVTIQTVPKSTTLSQSDINNVLRQVERIRLVIDNQEIDLTVLNAQFYPQQSGGYPFYFFSVEPYTIPLTVANNNGFPNGTTINPSYPTGVRIFLTPFLNGIQFANSFFNPLISNVNATRRSTVRYEADRDTAEPVPSNFAAILSGSATLAEVQDSIYTDTGLRNSRYDGTKTSTSNFGGVSPILLGREFIGESFTLDSTDAEVCVIDPSFRVLDNFFHTGPGKLPEYTLFTTTVDTQINTATETTIGYTGSFSGSDPCVLPNTVS